MNNKFTDKNEGKLGEWIGLKLNNELKENVAPNLRLAKAHLLRTLHLFATVIFMNLLIVAGFVVFCSVVFL